MLIVARNKVPGSDAEKPRPRGTAEVIVNPADFCPRNYFPHDSRQLVPDYYRAVPPGQIRKNNPNTFNMNIL
jgi:hypothetical protein